MNYTENLSLVHSTEVSNETQEKVTVRRRVYAGNENHLISLEDACCLTKRYRDSVSKDAMKGGFFGRIIFEKILAQDGCAGIRCYFAAFDDGTPTLVLTGVKANGNELWQGVLGEDVSPCPPFCSEYNPLNSDVNERTESLKRKTMVFTGHENHLVTLAEASRYTRNFRSGRETYFVAWD